jgi:hypothetical protein
MRARPRQTDSLTLNAAQQRELTSSSSRLVPQLLGALHHVLCYVEEAHMPLAVSPLQLPARHEHPLAARLALHHEVTAQHLHLPCPAVHLAAVLLWHILERACCLCHPVVQVQLGKLYLGLVLLVEGKFCAEPALDLCEPLQDLVLPDVLKAVVRWLLVLVRVQYKDHLDQLVVIVEPLRVLQAGVRRRQQGHHPIILLAMGRLHLARMVRGERHLALQAHAQCVCLILGA